MSASHQSPRSTSAVSPYDGYVNRDSWMISPASTEPSATAGMILSNGSTSIERDSLVLRPEPEEQVGGGLPAGDRDPGAGQRIAPGRHDERPAAAAQRPARRQQRVVGEQRRQRGVGHLDDVAAAGCGPAVEHVDVGVGHGVTGGASGNRPATQAWKTNVSFGQGEKASSSGSVGHDSTPGNSRAAVAQRGQRPGISQLTAPRRPDLVGNRPQLRDRHTVS